MAEQQKGLYTRILEGNEKSGECARNAPPKSRFQLFKDLFGDHIGKIVKINLLILLFFVPLLVVLYLSSMYTQTNAILYPFGANLGVGYPAMPNLEGVSEWLRVESGLFTCIGIWLSSIVASVGLAGGMYAVRNLIWTEGVFVVKDFWRGVKLNYKNALQAALFFCTVFLLAMTAINVAEFNIAIGAQEVVFLRISQVLCYILMGVAALMTLWMIALGVNYQSTFFTLFKNSFLMMIGTPLQTVFFGAIAILPFLAFLLGGVNTLFTSLALMAMTLLSFSFALLVWLNFTQWVFDLYVNPKTQATGQDKTIYNKEGTPQLTGDDSESVLEYQRAIVAAGKSKLLSSPIKPLDDGLEAYELPETFTRADLKKLKENKASLASDASAYSNEHKNDPVYVEYHERFEAREKALLEQENKDKKKKKK